MPPPSFSHPSAAFHPLSFSFLMCVMWYFQVFNLRLTHTHLFNVNPPSINLNEQLMEEVRDHIAESMRALERRMKSEFRTMTQDQSHGVGSRGSITGSTGTYAIPYYIILYYTHHSQLCMMTDSLNHSVTVYSLCGDLITESQCIELS